MPPNILKIVITGPESSGKTTLAAALAAALHTRYVPEFARTYLAHLGRPYERKDLKAIRLGQFAWEDWYENVMMRECDEVMMARPTLVCDTDWTVIHVWERYKFGVWGSEFEVPSATARTSNPELRTPNFKLQTPYFLCSPDIPWQPDPLREHPEERDVLFGMYEKLLRDIGAQYIVVSGSPEQRLRVALAAVEELIREN